MPFGRKIAVATFCIALGAMPAMSQSLHGSDGPAEIPPTSFQGKQYVDSLGCVYVRAGYDGVVTWVPRVTRARDQVCGYKPSLAAKMTTAALAVPVASTISPKPKPAVRSVAKPTRRVVRMPKTTRKTTVRKTAMKTTMPGFKSAWSDGRLNPNRGGRTLAGQAQMELVWTNTVPRRLVVKN